jgi:O-antigen/teichoic acid export membrane protein
MWMPLPAMPALYYCVDLSTDPRGSKLRIMLCGSGWRYLARSGHRCDGQLERFPYSTSGQGLSLKFRRAAVSSFARNSFTLVSGTAATQLIAAATAPVLARLYSPQDYGVLGLFMAFSGLLGVVASLQMVTAIVMPRRETTARRLLHLSFAGAVLLIAVATVPLWLAGELLARALGAPSLAVWMPLVPAAAAAGSAVTALNAYVNRHQGYGAMSASRVAGGIVGALLSIGLGWAHRTPAGLFAGFFGGLAMTFAVLSHAAIRADPLVYSRFEPRRLALVFGRYRNFAIVSTPAALLNNLVQQLPLYMLSTFSGSGAVGLFAMTNRLLGLPSVLISGAVAEVFRQRASSDYARAGTCRPVYAATARSLVLLGLAPALVLLVFAPDIFAFYLGAQWRTAGEFARVLVPLYFLRAVVSPLSYVFYIAERQRENLAMQIVMILVAAGGMYLGYRLAGSALAMLAFYSIGYSGVYVYYAVRGYAISRRPSLLAVGEIPA